MNYKIEMKLRNAGASAVVALEFSSIASEKELVERIATLLALFLPVKFSGKPERSGMGQLKIKRLAKYLPHLLHKLQPTLIGGRNA